MRIDRMTRMAVGALTGAIVGAVATAPLYLFIASVGMVPAGWTRSLIIVTVLCLPSVLVGAAANRHDQPDGRHWWRRIVPACLGAGAIGAILSAAPAFASSLDNVDATTVCFLSFGWLVWMQGAFFIQLAHAAPPRTSPAENNPAPPLSPYW